MNQTITIGHQQAAADEIDEITEVQVHLSDLGSCCMRVTMRTVRGQARHEVVHFGADVEGATDFADALMNEVWPTGWLFSAIKRYVDGLSFCHVKAAISAEDREKQMSWVIRPHP